MKKRITGLQAAVVVTLVFAALDPPTSRADAPDAKELVERANAALRGSSNHATMRMVVEGPGFRREREMEAWNRGTTEARILVTNPTNEMGTETLRQDKSLKMYMPTVSQIVTVPPSMMHQPWMGSDFDYDDIVKTDSIVSDYDHTIVSTEDVEGHQVFTIESAPKANAPIVWGKVKLQIRRDGDGVVNLLREEDYSERGELVRTIELSEIEAVRGRRVTTRLECRPEKTPGRRTVIKYGDIEWDVSLPDNFFSASRLRH